MVAHSKKHNHFLSLILLVIVLSVIFVFYTKAKEAAKTTPLVAPKIDGVVFSKPIAIKSFSLTDTSNQPFNNASLKGHWTLMFFGFTNCPFVCPTTMTELNKMYANLKQDGLPKALMPVIVMVSVDPHRDTVTRLRSYVTEFNPAFTGASGSMANLLALSKQMHVVFSKIQASDGDKNHYTITHTAELTLIDPQGQVRASFSYPHKANEMTKDYINLMHVYASK